MIGTRFYFQKLKIRDDFYLSELVEILESIQENKNFIISFSLMETKNLENKDKKTKQWFQKKIAPKQMRPFVFLGKNSNIEELVIPGSAYRTRNRALYEEWENFFQRKNLTNQDLNRISIMDLIQNKISIIVNIKNTNLGY